MGLSPDRILLALHLGVSLWVASPFVYFLTAGAKTFTDTPVAIIPFDPMRSVRSRI
jgi:hypothetical protein